MGDGAVGKRVDLANFLGHVHAGDKVTVDPDVMLAPDVGGKVQAISSDELTLSLHIPTQGQQTLSIQRRSENVFVVEIPGLMEEELSVTSFSDTKLELSGGGKTISLKVDGGKITLDTKGVTIDGPVDIDDPSATITVHHPDYEGLPVGKKFGELETWFWNKDLKIKSQGSIYPTLAAAEAEAQKVAASSHEDAIVVRHRDEGGRVFFRVYGVTEIRDQFEGMWSDNTLSDLRSDVVRVYMTDPGDDVTVRRARSGP